MCVILIAFRCSKIIGVCTRVANVLALSDFCYVFLCIKVIFLKNNTSHVSMQIRQRFDRSVCMHLLCLRVNTIGYVVIKI